LQPDGQRAIGARVDRQAIYVARVVYAAARTQLHDTDNSQHPLGMQSTALSNPEDCDLGVMRFTFRPAMGTRVPLGTRQRLFDAFIIDWLVPVGEPTKG
jgi:hypothetical protein